VADAAASAPAVLFLAVVDDRDNIMRVGPPDQAIRSAIPWTGSARFIAECGAWLVVVAVRQVRWRFAHP